MAGRDRLRRLFENRAFRFSAAGLLLLLAVWFFGDGLMRGSVADGCANELLHAVKRGDAAWLSAHVKSPSLKDRLVEAHRPDLLFVRPHSGAWSRIGLATRASDDATVAAPVYILLSHEEEGCMFIQDYDTNAQQ